MKILRTGADQIRINFLKGGRIKSGEQVSGLGFSYRKEN
jgi:hypothetical protein